MFFKHLTSSVLLIIMFCLLQGCEKDQPVSSPAIIIEQGAELLHMLEESGDYINNNNIPYITADELFLQRDSVIIIDVRRNSDYLDGHIEGAINLFGSALFDSLITWNSPAKIALVSGTGEASAYYTSLFRIAGFGNVYTLSFGMGSWNSYFSDVWLSRLRDHQEYTIFSVDIIEKVVAYPLPDPHLQGGTMKEKLFNKVKQLINLGFTEEINSSSPAVSKEFDVVQDYLWQYYVVCAGPPILYYSKTPGTYHLVGAANYRTFPPHQSDFRSISNLQSLPNEKEILVYSGSGQESAFITAYLRLLGYNASSVLLGCNNFSYSMLGYSNDLQIYQFNSSSIRNYPYIK